MTSELWMSYVEHFGIEASQDLRIGHIFTVQADRIYNGDALLKCSDTDVISTISSISVLCGGRIISSSTHSIARSALVAIHTKQKHS